jgi:hypothetical protein
MRLAALMVSMVILLAGAARLPAQMHAGNWVHWNGNDTTLVRCLNDTASGLAFPPGCFGRMGMFGDSIYCQFQYLPLDSIPFSVDTTFLCWRRLQIGSDSTSFGFMNCRGGSGGRSMMQFDRAVRCYLQWDTSLVGTGHRRWHPTGVRCWDGTRWVTMPDVRISGTGMLFTTTTLYSAIAVVGAPTATSDVALAATPGNTLLSGTNRPNPFSGVTEIGFTLSRPAYVTVAIFDASGEKVETIQDGRLEAGEHALPFDGSALPSGSYLYRISVDGSVTVGKAILTK